LYAHAITQLNSLYVRGDGGLTGYNRIPWTTKDELAIAFFWDSFISSVGAAEFDPELAKETVNVFINNTGPRGNFPGTVCDSHRGGEGQAPVMCWAVWNIYKRCNDKEWLKQIYKPLCGYINFWFKYHSSARGLCQYFNAGQIADNDARFDAIQKGGANLNLSGFESPDLNSFLVMEMNCLSFFANEIQKKDDAAEWKRKADELSGKINETMYFPDKSMYFDVHTGTHDIFSGVKSPNMFLPLWAGVMKNKNELDKIVKDHMLNPSEFYRELPFPSLSYDNPKYDPKGYWRGRIWPHVVYWMTQALWRSGYHKEAEVTADRLLKLILTSSPWIHENYESSKGGGIGYPEYDWSQSIVIELLLERYKEQMP
jgi:putative isomerase